MAFGDNRGFARANPVGVGGAVLINGLFVVGIIAMTPDILPGHPITRLIGYAVPPETPPVPPSTPVDDVKPSTGSVAVPKPDDTILPKSDSDLIKPFDGEGILTGGFGNGGIIEVPAIKVEPVFKNARLDPRYASVLQPSYPGDMIRAGMEGTVTVRVLIGPDGRVKAIEAVRADDESFLAATRKQALGKWRFIPATRDGAPVESWREMTVRFQLPD
jgi:periplasmic protein TonB